MTLYEVLLSKAARKQLADLPTDLHKKIIERFPIWLITQDQQDVKSSKDIKMRFASALELTGLFMI